MQAPPGLNCEQVAEKKKVLLSELQLFGNRLVTIHIYGLQVIQQPAAFTDHHQQSPARTMVFLVLLQVLSQMVDPVGQQCNLHIGRACIPLVNLEITNSFHFRLHVFQINSVRLLSI